MPKLNEKDTNLRAKIDLDKHLKLDPPPIPKLLENVILVFAKNIPQDRINPGIEHTELVES
jgi:hypothetical protein